MLPVARACEEVPLRYAPTFIFQSVRACGMELFRYAPTFIFQVVQQFPRIHAPALCIALSPHVCLVCLVARTAPMPLPAHSCLLKPLGRSSNLVVRA